MDDDESVQSSVQSSLSASSSPRIVNRYIPDCKFTLYSGRTDIVQADRLSELLPGQRSLQEFVAAHRTSQEPFWLDASAATMGEWRELANLFEIHPLTAEDVEQGEGREKVEQFDNYVVVCVRTTERVAFFKSSSHKAVDASKLADEDDRIVGIDRTEMGRLQSQFIPHPITLYIIMFEHYVLTVHWHAIDHVRNVLYRLQRDSRIRTPTPDWIGYALLDDIVDDFMGRAQAMQAESDSIEDLVLVLTSMDQHDLLRRIGQARRQIVSLQRQLKPKMEVTRSLSDRYTRIFGSATLSTTQLYLRDVQDHLLTMLSNLDHYASTLDRSHANYLAQINIELAEASNRMNLTVKKMSGIAALVVPISLVASIWGVNVAVPGQPATSWRDYGPFFIMLLIMTVLTALIYVYAKRKQWL